ncbi:metallophosphoesterase [Spongisporangium articulatum]|uniref:Metallophosphoesterase n=1 Tax=Spongisporangium articulatum TaxID=3362603 RepID=A0ABW8AJQ3_9ACTN
MYSALNRAYVTFWLWLFRRWHALAGVLVVALLGAVFGAALAPATTTEVGPLQAKIRVVPSFDPGVRLLLPPAGEVDFATHKAPFAVEGRIAQVDLEGARSLIDSPAGVRALTETAPGALRTAVIRAALTTVLFAFAGALVLSLLVFRLRWRRLAQVAATLSGVLVLTAGATAATADPNRLQQPQFTGLLSQAPYVTGSVTSALQRLETYRSGLADIVRSVTALYATADALPTLSTSDDDDVVTVLHVSDIHLNPLAFDLIDRLVQQFKVDVVVDTGDITTWGTTVESSTLSRIGQLSVPYVFVRGNHDSAATQRSVAAQKNAIVLDDRVVEVAGLTIAGIGDPNFTPDGDAAASPSFGPTRGGGTATVSPSSTGSPSASAPVPSTGAAGPSVSPSPSGPLYGVNSTLATTIDGWDARHPDNPVEIAAVHEPFDLQPLLGRVPTIMAGHTHSRNTSLDKTGTRVLVEGSTGGAGLTARGLTRLADGKPLPLAASLVYVARSGVQQGQVVATDAITVGGFGLTSVNLQRTVFRTPTVLRPAAEPAPSPTSSPSPTPSVAASGAASGRRED